MMYETKIKTLEEAHRILNDRIDFMQLKHPHVEEQKLQEMKKQKLVILDELSRLRRLQWEHDHEHIDLSDDR